MSNPPRTDLSPARACAGLAVRRASRAVSQHYDDALRPSGLRNSQFSLLVTLDQAGEVPVGVLAGWLRMDRTTLTRNAAVLEQRGLVASKADPSDRRSRMLRLTRDGRRAAEEAFPYWEQAQRQLGEMVGEAGLVEFVSGIDGLVERLDEKGAVER